VNLKIRRLSNFPYRVRIYIVGWRSFSKQHNSCPAISIHPDRCDQTSPPMPPNPPSCGQRPNGCHLDGQLVNADASNRVGKYLGPGPRSRSCRLWPVRHGDAFSGSIDALSILGLQDALVRRRAEGKEIYDTAFTLQLIRALLTSAIELIGVEDDQCRLASRPIDSGACAFSWDADRCDSHTVVWTGAFPIMEIVGEPRRSRAVDRRTRLSAIPKNSPSRARLTPTAFKGC